MVLKLGLKVGVGVELEVCQQRVEKQASKEKIHTIHEELKTTQTSTKQKHH